MDFGLDLRQLCPRPRLAWEVHSLGHRNNEMEQHFRVEKICGEL